MLCIDCLLNLEQYSKLCAASLREYRYGKALSGLQWLMQSIKFTLPLRQAPSPVHRS